MKLPLKIYISTLKEVCVIIYLEAQNKPKVDNNFLIGFIYSWHITYV